MSVVRLSPEFVATTFRDGDEFRVIEGGAPALSVVTDVRVVEVGGRKKIEIEVEDGFDGVRDIVFERLGPR